MSEGEPDKAKGKLESRRMRKDDQHEERERRVGRGEEGVFI